MAALFWSLARGRRRLSCRRRLLTAPVAPLPPTYPQVRTSRARKPPSTYRTAGQKVKEALSAVVNGIITVVRWCAGVPAALWALRLKSREQWAADWASMKKTIKHEAHHYWVRFGLKKRNRFNPFWGPHEERSGALWELTMQLGCVAAAGPRLAPSVTGVLAPLRCGV